MSSISKLPQPNPQPASPASIWSPLQQTVFRNLWIASAVSNVGTWMHDVGASWLMTSLSPSPLLVSLMQAAASLPFFLLALPAGAIADVVDRRKLLLLTQGWMLVVALLLGVLTTAKLITPGLLLGLTFALSIGSAINMPVWQAIVPELVPKAALASAVTLNGITINLARSIGPALAGMLIASLGNGAVFVANAVSFVVVLWVLWHWRREVPTPPFQFVLIRSGSYIFFASALFALLPVLGRREMGLNASGYGVILGFWGLGGLLGAYLLPRLRQRFSIDRLVAGASLMMGAMMLVLAYLRNMAGICGVMVIVGVASLTVMVSLNVSAQNAVASWVKARALSVSLLVFQGLMTLGSVTWGTVASTTQNLSLAIAIAGGGLVIQVLATRRFPLRCSELLDLSMSLHWHHPKLNTSVSLNG